MKKILALVLFVAMISLLALPVLAAPANPLPDNMVKLPVAPKADIVLDGARDDGYGDPYDLVKIRNDNTGATGKVWSAWNEKGVYYYMEVYDKTPNHEHGNPWERDNVEFFIDWNAARDDANNRDDDNPSWQVRIASKPNEDGNSNSGTLGDDDLEPGKDFVAKPIDGDYKNGYIIEICLPVAIAVNVNPPMAEGKVIYVDFQIGDNQEDGGRTSQVFLVPDDDDTDQQWQWPHANRGILKLGAAKAAPAPVVEAVPEAVGGGEAAEAEIAPIIAAVTPPPSVAAPSVRTGDAGIIALSVVMIAAAAGIVVFKRKAVK